RAAHEPAEARMRGRVLLEHEEALPGERLVDTGKHAVGGAHAGGNVMQEAVHVRVAREAPEADGGLVHRVEVAEPAERGIRVVPELGREGVAAGPTAAEGIVGQHQWRVRASAACDVAATRPSSAPSASTSGGFTR